MADLQRKALASLPMEASRVETLYAGVFGGVAEKSIKNLCVSHERLRADQQAEIAEIEQSLSRLSETFDNILKQLILDRCLARLRGLLPKEAR